MAQEYLLPIVIGVTGHKDIAPGYEERLYRAVCTFFRSLQTTYPDTPVRVLSPLAEGADLLCAKAAVECGCELVAPLPMPQQEYEQDFSEELPLFHAMLEHASQVFTVPHEENNGYRAAGQYVANHCHLLLALWDGAEKATPDGAGTYETIRIKLQGNAPHPLFENRAETVFQLVTPRAGTPAPTETEVGELNLYTGQNKTKPALPYESEVLKLVQQFNRDAARHEKLFSTQHEQLVHDTPQELSAVYRAADAMAIYYQKRRVSSLAMLSLCGLLLVLFFLFYDELDSPPMLMFYGAFLLFALLVFRISTAKAYHGKYLLYRMLAETLRVKQHLHDAGITGHPFPAYWWRNDEAIRFAEQVYYTVACECGPEHTNVPGGQWISEQEDYHQSSFKKKNRNYAFQTRLSLFFLIAAVAFFVIVALIEAATPGLMQQALPNPFHVIFPFTGDTLLLNNLFKIILGTLSAAAAFLANYFGKLDIDEQMAENDRMYTLYLLAGAKLDLAKAAQDSKMARQVLCALADAAITENLNWYHYNRGKTPELMVD